MAGDLHALCAACGLCCDGSLFGVGSLEPDEIEPARRLGLRVLRDAFEQPCVALVDRRCSIYEARPRACRRFRCHLYERHRVEGGPLDERLEAVARVRALLAALEAEGLTPADFTGESARPSPMAAQLFEELVRRLEEDFARAPDPPRSER